MAIPKLTKQPAESRLYDFDFSELLEGGAALVDTGTLSVTQANQGNVAGSAAVVIGTPTVSSPIVQVRVSGGTADEDYKLTALCSDDLDNILEVEGLMKVRDL